VALLFWPRLLNNAADLVVRTIEAKLKPLRSRVKTLMVGKGKEFVDHHAINHRLGIQTYLADPYCSWQRGSNEKFNGLLRQYIHKKRRMETVTDEVLTMIKNRLNYRPRKRLGFKTLHEVFHVSLNCVAVRT
jgi:IS30 family transposase